MKKLTTFIFIIFCFSTFYAQTPSVSDDEESLKNVIESESIAFLAGDADKVRSYYNFQPYTWGTVTFANGMSLHETGEAFGKFYDRIKPTPIISDKHSEFVYKINGNQAWVTNLVTRINKTDNTTIQSRQLRCFEKVNGAWKIVALSSHPIKINDGITSQMEEEAIKKVIIDETKAFNEGNIEALMDAHGDVPYFQWAVTNGGEPGDALTYRSTKAFKDWAINLPWFKNYNPNNPPKPSATQMLKDNWNIQIKGNIAIVTLDEHWINEQAKTKLDVTISKILEKLNGKWKIINTAAVGDFKDATPPIRSKY